jgi:hypothetical protein
MDKALTTSTQVIWEPWGGLGDALQYSTLPEMFNKELGVETYLSNSYVTRNPEITDLVWGTNPYIRGWSSLKATAGSVVNYIPVIGRSFIESIEENHGLTGRNFRPRIYYRPSISKSLYGKTLIDLSAVTLANGPYSIVSEKLRFWLDNEVEIYGPENFLTIEFSGINRIAPTPPFPRAKSKGPHVNLETLHVQSIFELADAIGSSRRFIGQHSGGVALCAALKHSNPDLEITCLISHALANSNRQNVDKIHNYADVSYTPI